MNDQKPRSAEFADVKAVALDFIIAAVGEQLPGMVRQAEEFAEALAPTVRERMAQAWDEGETAGMRNHSAYQNTGRPAYRNPHRGLSTPPGLTDAETYLAGGEDPEDESGG